MTIWFFPPAKPDLGGRCPPASRPTRQAWSSLRLPSALASAAWSSRWTCAAPRRGLDPLGAGDEVAGARLEAEPVERRLAQAPPRSARRDRRARASSPVLNARASAPRSLPLALAASSVGAIDPDPGAAAGRPGAHVGRDLAVRAEREADQLVARAQCSPRRGCSCARAVAWAFLIPAPRLVSLRHRGFALTRQPLIGRFPHPRPPLVFVLEPVGAGGHDDLVALLVAEAVFGEHAAFVLGPVGLALAALLGPLLLRPARRWRDRRDRRAS